MNGIQEEQKLESVQNANRHIGIEKKCIKCLKIKKLTEFSKNRRRWDGLEYYCRLCRNLNTKIYTSKKRDEINRKQRIWGKMWRLENPEKSKEKSRRWRIENPEKAKAAIKRWQLLNPVKVRTYVNKWHKKRRTTIKGKLTDNIRRSIRKSITNGSKAGRSLESIIGYTMEQLKSHIEKQFLPGMSWDNRELWHIDHIIPISAFNFEKPEDEDFKRCWALKNLQPLWAKDNLEKNNKLKKPFQPSLVFT